MIMSRLQPATGFSMRALRSVAGFGSLLLIVTLSLASAQTGAPAPQVILDNDFVRVSRITIPANGTLNQNETNDTVLVRLSDETAKFLPKGSAVHESNPGSQDIVDLIVELKKHWTPAVRSCAAPAQCTRETKIGHDPIAWSTTLFTNGFLTAISHKLVEAGTLTSSYYTAKGGDKILVIPFTDLDASFGGNEERLKAGEPYFTDGTQVEVAASGGESRWLVLRMNAAKP
jgi:hypothetical protein